MDRIKETSTFITCLAVLAVLADILTLWQFISTKTYLDFFTKQWHIHIFFILLLFGIIIGLFALAKRGDYNRIIFKIYGWGYLLINNALYLFWGYSCTFKRMYIKEYWGFLTLFLISAVVGITCIFISSREHLRFPAYLYGLTSFIACCFMIYIYTFQGALFRFNLFIGQMIVFIIGAVLFLVLFKKSGA